MPMIPAENLAAARRLYRARIKALMDEMQAVVDRGIFLGEAFEKETSSALTQIEEEVDGIQECLDILNHLQKQL